MKMDAFITRLLDAALAAGIETAEASYGEGESFSARCMDGEIESYEVSSSASLSLRGTVGGRMGYAFTEAFDDEAIAQLVAQGE